MGNKAKILIIDDEEDILFLYETFLSSYDIRCVTDPEDFNREILDLKPDLIISDMQMPKKNGNVLIKELRARGADTPVIFVTGDDHSIWSKDAKSSISNMEFVSKPFSASDLKRKIENLVLIKKAA